MKNIISLVVVCFLIACQKEQLIIKEIQLCEYFTSDGNCKQPLNVNHTYEIKIPKSKKIDTWETLSNYLYFHSRETPGFIIKFNRKFTLSELEIIKKSYKSYYEFSGYKGKVEGVEFGEDWIGSFQYLGSIIKDRQKERNELKNYISISNMFPAKLKFEFYSDLFSSKTETEINIKLNYE